MGLTGWSSANYLSRVTATFGPYPHYVSIWGTISGTTAGTVRTAVQPGTTATHRRSQTRVVEDPLSGDRKTRAGVQDAAGFSQALSGGGYPADGSWFHFSGAYVSTTLREARWGGANLGTNTVSRNPDAADRIFIGRRTDGTGEEWKSTDGLAEVSYWDITGFTEANRTSLDSKLAAGENPRNVNAEASQPWTGKLVAYWIDSANTITDLSGNGHDLTQNGTLTDFGSHPTIDASVLIMTETESISISESVNPNLIIMPQVQD